FRRARDAPCRDCNAVIGKQLLRLVFVEIHVGSMRGKDRPAWGRAAGGHRCRWAAAGTGGTAILADAGAAGQNRVLAEGEGFRGSGFSRELFPADSAFPEARG